MVWPCVVSFGFCALCGFGLAFGSGLVYEVSCLALFLGFVMRFAFWGGFLALLTSDLVGFWVCESWDLFCVCALPVKCVFGLGSFVCCGFDVRRKFWILTFWVVAYAGCFGVDFALLLATDVVPLIF